MSDWKSDLRQTVEKKDFSLQHRAIESRQQEENVEQFYSLTVLLAFKEFEDELIKLGRHVKIQKEKTRFSLVVTHENKEELDFGLNIEISHSGIIWPSYTSYFIISKSAKGSEAQHDFHIEKGKKSMADVSKDDILQALAQEYKKRLQQSSH